MDDAQLSQLLILIHKIIAQLDKLIQLNNIS